MAPTTSNRQTRIPVQSSTLVKERSIPTDAVQAKIEEIRLQKLAEFKIEQEARLLRQEEKKAVQDARNREEKIRDAQRQEDRDNELRILVRSMSDSEFRKFRKRIDYIPPALEEAMRERDGLPTVSKAIKSTSAEDLMAELKRRGIMPQDFQLPSTTSATQQEAESSIDLNDPAENAASGA